MNHREQLALRVYARTSLKRDWNVGHIRMYNTGNTGAIKKTVFQPATWLICAHLTDLNARSLHWLTDLGDIIHRNKNFQKFLFCAVHCHCWVWHAVYVKILNEYKRAMKWKSYCRRFYSFQELPLKSAPTCHNAWKWNKNFRIHDCKRAMHFSEKNRGSHPSYNGRYSTFPSIQERHPPPHMHCLFHLLLFQFLLTFYVAPYCSPHMFPLPAFPSFFF